MQGIRQDSLGDVRRGWAERARKSWHGWAIRSCLKPIERQAVRTVADLEVEEKSQPRALAEALCDRATELESTGSAELPDPAADRFRLA